MSASNTKTSRLVVPLAALSLCLVFCAHSSAQTPGRARTAATPPPLASPSPAATPDASQSPSPAAPARAVSDDEADLAIIANVTARELKFEAVPNSSVEFTGRPERATLWEAERTNLPRPVQPGVTYRDIGIRLRIVSVFADIDRIVAEALGEVPKPEDAPPTAAPAAAPPPPPNETPEEKIATSREAARTTENNAPAANDAPAASDAPAVTTAARNGGTTRTVSRATRPRARRLR